MNIKIRDEEVKFENGTYSFFPCTCAEEDEKFWKELTVKVTEQENDQATGLIHIISHCFRGYITSISADMWMGFGVETNEEKISIQCDIFEYGMVGAITILAKLHPEIAKEYEWEFLLDI